MAIERLYTIIEAAEVLRIKQSTMYKWVSGRKITSIKGSPVLIPESSIKLFLRKRTRRAVI